MIILEGIIGAGKTTLCLQLQKLIPRSVLYLEPVETNPYLERFYKDPVRWALEMQWYLMARRYMMHRDAIALEWESGKTTIFDRSIYGDQAFAYLLWKDGLIDENGYASYQQHRECMEKSLLIPQQVIYLDIRPGLALDWISSRGRECEKNIPLNYLEKLDDAYKTVVLPPLQKKTRVDIVSWEDGMTADDLQISGRCEYDTAAL